MPVNPILVVELDQVDRQHSRKFQSRCGVGLVNIAGHERFVSMLWNTMLRVYILYLIE